MIAALTLSCKRSGKTNVGTVSGICEAKASDRFRADQHEVSPRIAEGMAILVIQGSWSGGDAHLHGIWITMRFMSRQKGKDKTISGRRRRSEESGGSKTNLMMFRRRLGGMT